MLTKRQKQVLDFVRGHVRSRGYAPTIAEIRRHLGLGSVATVHKHLRLLQEKGAVRRLPHRSRALEVCDVAPAARAARVRLLGTVAAGTPIEPLEIEERGKTVSRRARAIVSNLPFSIAEREAAVLQRRLGWLPEEIAAESLPDAVLAPPREAAPAPSAALSLEEVERRHVQQVLASSGTLEEAAARLGIDPTTLWRKRKRWGLD